MMGANGPRVDRSMSLSGAAAQAIMNSPSSAKSPRESDSFRESLQTSSHAHLSGFHLPPQHDASTSGGPSESKATDAERIHALRNLSSGSMHKKTAPSNKEPFIIGVSGGTASGKTTVCEQIIQSLRDHRVVLIGQDSFYKGLTDEQLKHVSHYNFDHPDALDMQGILDCLNSLKAGNAVELPVYDFCTHQRSSMTRKTNPADVIILEGVLAFHDSDIRSLMNMKIFVDTDADVRLARRIRRDTVERGRDVAGVIEQYARFVKPAFDDFVLPTKKHADIIIPRGGDNHVAVDLIVQHIRTKLGMHDIRKIYANVHVIESTFHTRGMHTLIRNHRTRKHDFVFYADRLIRLVVEHGLGHLPFTDKQVTTPTGSTYVGVEFCHSLCGVSIIRSGEAMENALRACVKGIRLGKILIHREGDDGREVIYEKLPSDIASRHVLLLDPIVACGSSALKAIETLIAKGVHENHIIFLNLISAPEGIHAICKHFPRVKIVTSEIDSGINDNFRVIPGVGEFGDRYFGTEENDDEEEDDEKTNMLDLQKTGSCDR